MNGADRVSPGEAAAGRVVPLAALMVVIAAVVLGSLTVRAFNEALEPEFSRRSQLIGSIVRADLQRALELGIPLNELTGTRPYLEKVLADFPEVSAITLRSREHGIVSRVEAVRGKVLSEGVDAQADDPSAIAIPGLEFTFPVLAGNELAGEIAIDIDGAYVRRQFRDVFLDVLVVILVAVLLAFEITLAVTTTSLRKPLDQLDMLLRQQVGGDFSGRLKQLTATSLDRVAARFSDHAEDLNARFRRLLDAQVPSAVSGAVAALGGRFCLSADGPQKFRLLDAVDIRLPLFLFAAGSELSKPFLPLYVRGMIPGDTGLREAVIVSLPLIAYLADLMVLSLLSGYIAERLSPRRVFLLALVPVVVSQIGLGLSGSVAEIVIWQGITGAGFALATNAAQDYALTAASARRRTRAAAGYVAVVIGGAFAGTAIGGVLADRIGQANVFFVGAVVIGLAAAIGLAMLSEVRGGQPRERAVRARFTGILAVFRNLRFVALLTGIAIPVNVLMAAFLWYLVPLMLADFGASPADTGRALMLYYLLIVLIAPFGARVADRFACAPLMLTVGGLISGIALVALSRDPGFWGTTAAIVVCGIAHAAIRAPLIAHVLELDLADTAGDGSAMQTALRTFELVGGILGLLLTAVLAGKIGYATAVGFTGLTVAGGAVFFAAVTVGRRWRWKRTSP
ncbi:MAG TPA: MFS transporter [Pelomicrobium sp.]|nr:MFS transporter [Pelomicrobium sp.]